MRTPYTGLQAASGGRPPLRNHLDSTSYPTRVGPNRTLAPTPEGGSATMPKPGNFIRTVALVAVAAVVAAVAAASAGAAPARKSGTTISGAGSSFVAPLVNQWIP